MELEEVVGRALLWFFWGERGKELWWMGLLGVWYRRPAKFFGDSSPFINYVNSNRFGMAPLAPWIIILLGLWIYPIFSLVILQLIKNRPRVRMLIYYVSFSMSGLAIFGLWTTFSTTLTIVDWFLVSTIYLSIALALGWTQLQNRKWMSIIGMIFMFFVYGTGYLSASIGALGVRFVISDFETSHETWLKNGIICKEITLGNAVADYRGKRVEVYQTISWLPIVEWRVQKKEYYDVLPYLNRLNVTYSENEQKIYLSTSAVRGKGHQTEYWADTITLRR